MLLHCSPCAFVHHILPVYSARMVTQVTAINARVDSLFHDALWVAWGVRLLGLPYQNATDWGCLTNRNVLSHGYGGWKPKIKGLAGLVSSETSPFGLQMSIFLLCGLLF